MTYSIKFRPAAAKDLYKLIKKNKELGRLIIEQVLPGLVVDPLIGRRKQGDLRHIRSLDFNFKGTAYRLLYEVKEEVVRIHAIGTHDVSYRKVKSRK